MGLVCWCFQFSNMLIIKDLSSLLSKKLKQGKLGILIFTYLFQTIFFVFSVLLIVFVWMPFNELLSILMTYIIIGVISKILGTILYKVSKRL